MTTRRATLVSMLAGAAAACTGGAAKAAADADPQPLTAQRFASALAASGAPGMAVRGRRAGGDAPIAFQGGQRRIDAPDAVTPDDLWHLGSCGKSMTATVVARVVEAGKLAWDAPFASLVPSIADAIRPEFASVTLVQLLSHTSGLRPNPPPTEFLGEMYSFADGEGDARAERIRFARNAVAAKPVGPVGTSMTYSNSGYVLAGAALEHALDKPFNAIMRELLFDPLGLSTAGFGPVLGDNPRGHRPKLFGGLGVMDGPEADNPIVLTPAGRMHMSLSDLLTYLEAHRDRRTDLLTAASWEKLHTPILQNYALGWLRTPDGAIWHNGSNTMWYAEMMFKPSNGVVAAVAANSGDLKKVQPAVRNVLRDTERALTG